MQAEQTAKVAGDSDSYSQKDAFVNKSWSKIWGGLTFSLVSVGHQVMSETALKSLPELHHKGALSGCAGINTHKEPKNSVTDCQLVILSSKFHFRIGASAAAAQEPARLFTGGATSRGRWPDGMHKIHSM